MKKHGRFCSAVLILTVLVTAQMEVAAQTLTNGQFQILSLRPMFNPFVGSNGYVITWNAATGQVNNVTYTDSLDAPWQNLVGFFPNYRPTTMVATDYPPVDATQRFYQVKANIRPHVIVSLVLDRSGSMFEIGSALMPPAVTNFISLFDDITDYAAQISFASAASVDVPMTQPFIAKIQNAALGLTFGGYSCVDQGLTNALAQNNTVTTLPGENVVKVIVVFTSGIDTAFNYVFNCGARNIGYSGSTLFDPATGNIDNTGCTVPAMLSSINPSNGVLTANAVNTGSCNAMCDEAENRAERIAYLARSQGNTIYCVEIGSPTGPGVCNNAGPTVSFEAFLQDIANTTNSATYNPAQPSGLSVIATNTAQLSAAAQTLALQMFSQ